MVRLQAEEIKAVYNAYTQSIEIYGDLEGNDRVTLFDVLGRRVTSGKALAKIPVSDLPTGIYLVDIRGDYTNYCFKLFIH